MKKIILSGLMLAFAASNVHAAATGNISFGDGSNAGKSIYGTATAAGTEGEPIGKLSTNVSLAFNTGTEDYAIITQHKNATRAYGTASDSTSIFQSLVAKGAETVAPTNNSVEDVFLKQTKDEDGNVTGTEPNDPWTAL